MDSWKAEVRRVKIRRKKMQMREKVGKSRNTVFFQWFVAPVGRKVGSLKRRVRTQLARWEMKNCTPLWREAHFISKSKCTKHLSVGPLLEVEMLKKCTALWRRAHLEVQMSLASITLHYTPLHYTTLHNTTATTTQLHSTTLHYTPLHSTSLHYTKSHYTTLDYITLHYLTFHYTSLHYTTLHYTTTTTTQLHSTTILH